MYDEDDEDGPACPACGVSGEWQPTADGYKCGDCGHRTDDPEEEDDDE